MSETSSGEGNVFAGGCPDSGSQRQWIIDDLAVREGRQLFALKNKASNKCLDIVGEEGKGQIRLFNCEGKDDQKLCFKNRGGIIAHGQLQNVKSLECVNPEGVEGVDRNLRTSACDNHPDQLFTLFENGEVVNACYGLCVDIAGYDGGVSNVGLYLCDSFPDQKWSMIGNGDAFQLLSKSREGEKPGYCLDVEHCTGSGNIGTFHCQDSYCGDEEDQTFRWLTEFQSPRGKWDLVSCHSGGPFEYTVTRTVTEHTGVTTGRAFELAVGTQIASGVRFIGGASVSVSLTTTISRSMETVWYREDAREGSVSVTCGSAESTNHCLYQYSVALENDSSDILWFTPFTVCVPDFSSHPQCPPFTECEDASCASCIKASRSSPASLAPDTQAPSTSPTIKPTTWPTISPTEGPTAPPTESATPEPTTTTAPTEGPSVQPTESFTPEPTQQTTLTPSAAMTFVPTTYTSPSSLVPTPNWGTLRLQGVLKSEYTQDRFGADVGFSKDGTRLAVSANNLGYVMVFERSGSSWKQLGQTIFGNGGGFGSNIAVNEDGSVLAVGAWGLDGPLDGAGQVIVYQFDGSFWHQLGNMLDGDESGDGFGWDVALSDDGKTLVVSGLWGTGLPSGVKGGYVRVYAFESDEWKQKGADILGDDVNGEFGRSVAISSNGNRVALGAKLAGHVDQGQVKVFDYIGKEWSQVGETLHGEQMAEYFGSSVGLSSDGFTLVAAADGNDKGGDGAGLVRIYRLVGNMWKLHDEIVGECCGGVLGAAHISISNDGSTVVVGAQHLGNNSGKAYVYRYSGSTREQVVALAGHEADFLGSSVACSGDGLQFAFGAPSDDSTGFVQIWSFN